MIVLKMVLKEKSSEVGKSTSELANHTSKSIHFAQIDLKINNADVEKTTKPENRIIRFSAFQNIKNHWNRFWAKRSVARVKTYRPQGGSPPILSKW